MLREYVCIMCPRGCEIEAEVVERQTGRKEGEPAVPQVLSVTGNLCPRGKDYVLQEVTAPKRSIASSIRVKGGELPLASVRLTRPIPREDIFRAMEQIKKAEAKAPLSIGQVVIRDLLGTGSDVIVTKNIGRMDS
ncbi:DUF1667 domain-containing protein [Lachnospiraceae bacterium 54-53]